MKTESGAVRYEDCPTRDSRGRCRCGPCKVCGFAKHMAIHGPAKGQPAGSKPWGHEFEPKESKANE